MPRAWRAKDWVPSAATSRRVVSSSPPALDAATAPSPGCRFKAIPPSISRMPDTVCGRSKRRSDSAARRCSRACPSSRAETTPPKASRPTSDAARRTTPKSPWRLTWMRRIGLGGSDRCASTPRAPSAFRLAAASASLRSSKPGGDSLGRLPSTSAMRYPRPSSAQARLLPTSPPPSTTMSKSIFTGLSDRRQTRCGILTTWPPAAYGRRAPTTVPVHPTGFAMPSQPQSSLASGPLLLVGMIVLAALSRLLPHPPNFSPVEAIALFGGAYFMKRSAAIWVPLVAMFISDLALGVVNGGIYSEYFLSAGFLLVYLCIALSTVVGFALRGRVTAVRVAGYSLVGSVLFFLVTNFGAWLGSAMYPQTGAGLVSAYVAGIPFFQNTVLGTLFYSVVLFGSFALLRRRIPALGLQTA